jgi:putative transposase
MDCGMTIHERTHRLPRGYYQGEISAAFTLCIQKRAQTFIEPSIISDFIGILDEVAANAKCIIPVYCFMPDHQHFIITGKSTEADVWSMIVKYKQRTGFWLSRHRPEIRWQKDFYDHIIRAGDNLATQTRYILDNPVRRNLVPDWREYPYKGSIGCDLDAVLNSII